MSEWPKETLTDLNRVYGNPDVNHDFRPDKDWERANIVRVVAPYQLYYPKKVGRVLQRRAIKLPYLRVHRKCAGSLQTVLRGIRATFSDDEIHRYELDISAGAMNFRLKRDGKSLSVHSWGAAVDLSHLINGWKVKYDPDPRKKMMPLRVVDLFREEGWTWGGRWSTPDAMHFQAADR